MRPITDPHSALGWNVLERPLGMNFKDPQMRKMAQSIISAQKKEFAQFDRFLAKHGHPPDKMSK